MIVLDASAVLELLLGRPAGAAVQTHISRRRESLHAPHLLDAEVAQVLRRYHLAGEITDARGRESLRLLSELAIHRHPHRPLLPRVWDLRANMSAYDGLYVALAEALRAPLLTADARLQRGSGHRARIEVVGA